MLIVQVRPTPWQFPHYYDLASRFQLCCWEWCNWAPAFEHSPQSAPLVSQGLWGLCLTLTSLFPYAYRSAECPHPYSDFASGYPSFAGLADAIVYWHLSSPLSWHFQSLRVFSKLSATWLFFWFLAPGSSTLPEVSLSWLGNSSPGLIGLYAHHSLRLHLRFVGFWHQ